jgi:hypothetical protein
MNGWWNGKGPFRSRPSSPPPPPPSHDLLLIQRKNLTSSSRMAMELSSKFRLLRPLLLMRSPFPARSRALQTLARPSPLSLLLPSRGLPLLPPHRFPLVPLRPFASVFPSPSPAPGRDHGPLPPPAPLPPPPPEELASEDEAFYHEHLLEVAQENQSRVVPVKAFFLCTRLYASLCHLVPF